MPVIKPLTTRAEPLSNGQTKINDIRCPGDIVDISSLIFDPSNARLHPEKNMEAIKASLTRHGQLVPLVVRRSNRVVVAGNGRLQAAIELGWTQIAVTFSDMDDLEHIAFGVADNRTSDLAEWDYDVLAMHQKLLEEAGSGMVGWSSSEILALRVMRHEENAGNGADIDATEDQRPIITQPGDVWELGKHRLICGDATDLAVVDELMQGERVQLSFTSPPYAQQRDYDAGQGNNDWDALMCGGYAHVPLTNDGQVLVNLGLTHREGEWQPYWERWIEWMRTQGWRRFGWYVWDQGFGLPGSWGGRMAPAFEFVWHFNRAGVPPTPLTKWMKKKETSIGLRHGSTFRQKDGTLLPFDGTASMQQYKIPDSVIRLTRQVGSDGHPAQFPPALPEFIMRTWRGDVYDPFIGSGSTLLGAERLGRRCFGVELSPRYCDIVCRRWLALGEGRDAVRVSDGARWSELAADAATADGG